MKAHRLLRLILVSLLFVIALPQLSCDKGGDAPRRENPGQGGNDDPDKPGNERPGADKPGSDFASELADSTLRYCGPSLKLRFDKGGILFKKHSDGRREIVDLERSVRVELVIGTMRTDSLCPDARLTLKGETVPLKSVKMKKQTAEAVWYHIVGSDGRSHVAVLP